MDYRRLDLNLLLVLDALFEERSVTAVAKHLRISQPTVSFSLNKLRAFFGDELFVRMGSTMQPTPFAERVREPIRRIVETIKSEILSAPSFEPSKTTRTFALSLSDIGELVFLPRLLAALRLQAPQASVRCLSMPPAALELAMANGTVDIALGYFPDLTGGGFYQQKLFEHPFVCLVRPDHPQVGDAMSLDQFVALDHAVVSSEGRSQELFERTMKEMGLERRVALESPHFMSIPLLVSDSDMVTTVPLAVGRTYAKFANIKLVRPPIDIPRIELKQFWHRRVHSDPGVTWIRSLIAELFLQKDPSIDPTSPFFEMPSSVELSRRSERPSVGLRRKVLGQQPEFTVKKREK